jgi:Zn-dependent peptidase ImmA (M78 family)
MNRSPRKAIALAKARELLAELQIVEPNEIDVENIAFYKNVEVCYEPLKGMDGSIVRQGASAVIKVNNNIGYIGQKRFVIAHELGHFFLHPDVRQMESVDSAQANNWSESQEREEYEANLFAAELLIPLQMIQSRIVGKEPSFKLIEALAEEFQTTLTSTAVQFIQATNEECALISCSNRTRLWFMKSPGFSFSLLDENYVHGHSCAVEVNNEKRSSRSSQIEAAFWLDGFRGNRKAYITEDAKYFPSLKRSLSLLWIHDCI